MARCVLTSKDEIILQAGGGFLINGKHRPNLDNCKLMPGARFELQIAEAEQPKAYKRSSRPSAPRPEPIKMPEPAVPPQPIAPPQTAQSVQLPSELAEVKELMSIYQSAQGLGPYVAIAVVAYVMWQKMQRKGQQECQRCADRERSKHIQHHDPATCPECIAHTQRLEHHHHTDHN